MSISATKRKTGEGLKTAHPRCLLLAARCAKINVDASMAKTTTGGVVGDVCRSADGVFLDASSLTAHGITNPATMEAIACREAIALAQDLQLNRITVASDYLTVINALRQPFYGFFSMVLDEVKSNAAQLEKVTFRHENRSSNIDALMLTTWHVWQFLVIFVKFG
jgi:ribonuclease HI